MTSVLNEVQSLCYATADLPFRDRVPFWRDSFAEKIIRIEFEPDKSVPFEASTTIRMLPPFGVVSRCKTTAVMVRRPSRLISDGDDAVTLITNLDGQIAGQQCGRQFEVGPCQSVMVLHRETAEIKHSSLNYFALIVPYETAAQLVGDVGAVALRPLPLAGPNGAMHLLVRYMDALTKDVPLNAEVAHAAATHIRDLFALALGARGEVAHLARIGGLRAARLEAIKADILRNLTSAHLNITAIAKRAGVTPRYVQKLFEIEGMTFSEHVLEQRLRHAHALLTKPGGAGRAIADIAYESGFGDLSYFNRTFRRRFNASPSEVRSEPR
jgi:AraC-like DNA-binding protein